MCVSDGKEMGFMYDKLYFTTGTSTSGDDSFGNDDISMFCTPKMIRLNKQVTLFFELGFDIAFTIFT